jgi:hypothetical protein
MRLADLHPRWIGDHDAPPDAKQGVGFECPHCRSVRLCVWFANPICPNPPVDPAAANLRQATHGHLADHHMGDQHWQRTGDTFETLTLSPSIDCSRFGHWHGHVQDGAIA